MRAAIYIFGVLFVAAICFLMWQFYATSRINREATRMDVVFTRVSTRLQAQRQASGQYPDSLAALSFTNSTELQMLNDVKKIIYQRTASGYTLSYTGFAGYHTSFVFSEDGTSH